MFSKPGVMWDGHGPSCSVKCDRKTNIFMKTLRTYAMYNRDIRGVKTPDLTTCPYLHSHCYKSMNYDTTYGNSWHWTTKHCTAFHL